MKIDLTYKISEGMFKYPSDPEVKIERKDATFEDEEEIIYDESGYTSGVATVYRRYKSGYVLLHIRNHHGTHIDAPAHKIAWGKTIDKYVDEKFTNNCALIDLTSSDLMGRKERKIGKEDIERACDLCSYNGVEALIFYTGFCDEMEKNKGRFKANSAEKINFEKTFPYFSKEAASFIIEKSNCLNIIGIDSFSVDKSGCNSEVHRIFFSKDILPLETLAELRNKAGKNVFKLFSIPLYDADAAQTRAYAIYRRENDGTEES